MPPVSSEPKSSLRGGISLIRTLSLLLALMAVSAFAAIPYVAVSITAITNSPPNGPWKFNTHAAVTGYILDWQLHPTVDGDRHIVVCDSPNFTVTKSVYAPDLQ